LADIFPLHYASSRYFYAQLEHRNANSTSIYNSVNEFLEALTTERNKVPSTTHKQEKPSGGVGILKSWLCKRGVPYYYLSGERFAFTKHLSTEKFFNPSLFQENANHHTLPSTELKGTVGAHPVLCKEWLTT